MQFSIEILGKPVIIECSDAAIRALDALDKPLLVEMELYFSCLIRKAVRFNPSTAMPHAVAASSRLTVGFRPICTKVCKADDFEDEPPVQDFQIMKPEAFVPRKLSLDYRKGQWWGEFQMAL